MEKSHNLQKILIKYCNHCLHFPQMLFEKCFVQFLLLAEILTSTDISVQASFLISQHLTYDQIVIKKEPDKPVGDIYLQPSLILCDWATHCKLFGVFVLLNSHNPNDLHKQRLT